MTDIIANGSETAPTIDVAVGYNRSNSSPILKLFLSRLDDLVGPNRT